MSLFSISLSGIATDILTGLLDYLVQPVECIIQDVINWIMYALLYFAKISCDVFFTVLQTIYNFVLGFLTDVITVLAGTINNVVNTIRSKLVPAFVVAVTPKAEEKLITYAIRGVTSANSFRQGIVRGILAGLMGMGIPFLAYLTGSIIDTVIPSTPIDVTNLLFPIQTLRQLASNICCPITAVIPPQCSNSCGVSGFPVCSQPCVEMNTGTTYCLGVQFVTQSSTTTTPSTSVPPAQTVTFTQGFTVTVS